MKNKLIAFGLWALLWFSVLAGSVWAQSSSQAYFQWMNAVTVSTPEIGGHLQFAGVSSSKELEQAAIILAKFKVEEFGLEASYNNLPSTLAGSDSGAEAFLARQTSLVERTIGKLITVLSKESMARLSNHVQQEWARNVKLNTASANSSSHQHLMPVKFSPSGGGMGFYNVHYVFYTTWSITPTGDGSGNANFVVISQITGNTSCPSGCVGPIHQARVVNNLGGAPAVYGPQVSPVTYMNVQNNQAQFEPFGAPVSPVKVGTGGEVDCSQVGNIQGFGITWHNLQFEDAETHSVISALLKSDGFHPQAPYCSIPSSPADLEPATEADPSIPAGQYVETAFMWREILWTQTDFTGVPWNRAIPLNPEHIETPTFEAPDCTNWDNHYRGVPPVYTP